MKIKKTIYFSIVILLFILGGVFFFKKVNSNPTYHVGQAIDSLHGVIVYYNGGVDHVTERNVSIDGYNIGLKYQCVEFVKRYYYEYYQHKMPDTYGHAKDFFNLSLEDGQKNEQRNLIQYKNPSKQKPQIGDLVVLSATISNRYGHVAIISKVEDTQVEIIQQNPGPFGKSRERYDLINLDNQWKIDNNRVLGWLRKNDEVSIK